MDSRSGRLALDCVRAVLVALLSTPPVQAVVYPQRGLVDLSAGFVIVDTPDYVFRGSGAVVRDDRLVYSCAHVLFDNGKWATTFAFRRAWHAQSWPSINNAQHPRGFRHFSDYAAYVAQFGDTDDETFNVDFTIFYSNLAFGTAMPYRADGAAAVSSSAPKRIVGYPGTLDYTGQPGYAYQHATPWFTARGSDFASTYFEFDNVSTGGGTSGGPIYVRDSADNAAVFAGVLVAGTNTTAGVRVHDSAADEMAVAALGAIDSLGESVTFSNANAFVLPDGATRYRQRAIAVSGFTSTLRDVEVSLSIATLFRGDLDVYLVAPNGRVQWISRRDGASAKNLSLRYRSYRSRFAGLDPNGTWRLFMRDAVPRDRATFKSFSLRVTAPRT
jgi:hypothetical protein